MINIRVLPIWSMEDEDFGDKLVISIVSPGTEHPNIKGSKVYKFHFHDVPCIYEMPDGSLIRPMSESIAEEIADIALNNLDRPEWVIHCEAGISRSPAVAIGLSKFIRFKPGRQELKKMFTMHNKYVVKLIEEAMECKIVELDGFDIGG